MISRVAEPRGHKDVGGDLPTFLFDDARGTLEDDVNEKVIAYVARME